MLGNVPTATRHPALLTPLQDEQQAGSDDDEEEEDALVHEDLGPEAPR